MQLIKPSQISGEIMTLIEEADQTLILVSPYCNFSGWNKFKKAIELMTRKGIEVEFFIRENEQKSYDEVISLGYDPYQIENLHTKLYINEKHALVSSMNLLKYSDEHSLDIALKTETKEEYDEIWDYYQRYIAPHRSDSQSSYRSWEDSLIEEIRDKINRKFRLHLDEATLVIQGPNRYLIHISNEYRKNLLNISGILSSDQKDMLEPEIDDFQKRVGIDLKIYEPGTNGWGYNTIWHHSKKNLKSHALSHLYKSDEVFITEAIVTFISAVEEFKNSHR